MVKKERKPFPVILNHEEKKKFIEILLIIGSLLTGLISIHTEILILLIPSFTIFIICSLILIVWISLLDKMQWDIKLKKQKFNRSFIVLLSGIISVSFSSIIASIYILGIQLNGFFGVIGFIGLYISLTAFLWPTLSRETIIYEPVDVVD